MRSDYVDNNDKPPTRKEKLANFGGSGECPGRCRGGDHWLGIYGLYQVMTDARVAELDVVGVRSEAEKKSGDGTCFTSHYAIIISPQI